MDKVKRFSVSIEPDLLTGLDGHVAKKGYATRSEAIRDMIRDTLVKHKWQVGKRSVTGTITMVYAHHASGVTGKLMGIQHAYHGEIHSATHVHMDQDVCLEVLVVSGKPGHIITLADKLKAVKGVQHAELVMTGEAISSRHHHHH
jgi:CopG family nickel-responsive transcriptional regulator